MTHDPALQRRFDRTVWLASLAFGLYAMHAALAAPPAGTAAAASRATGAPASAEASWRQECGDCHVAYAPRLLPPSAWGELMRGLDRHFGVDASLDPATGAAIARWLERAGARDARGGRDRDDREGPTARRVAPTAAKAGDAPRITTTAWFVREHREVPAATWRRPAIGRPSNCGACHVDASQGRYREHALNIPH
jgi:hypothetical protein